MIEIYIRTNIGMTRTELGMLIDAMEGNPGLAELREAYMDLYERTTARYE